MTDFTEKQLDFLKQNVTMSKDGLSIQDINCDVEGNVNGIIKGDIGSIEGNIRSNWGSLVYCQMRCQYKENK